VLGGEATHSNFIVLAWPDRGSDQRSTAFASITPLTWSALPKTNTCTWPGGSTGFFSHFVIPVLYMSSSVTQLIMLWFLSTHPPGLNWQRNPGSNVVVSKYFDSSRRLYLSSIKSQLLNVSEASKELFSKYWGPKCFCITFSAETRIFTISNDDFDQ
jgi:hypothetical protein